jgi:hypothetical protein
MEFNLNGLPNNVVPVSGFCGNGGIVQLNAVSLADTVLFGCATDAPLTHVHGMAYLLIADSTAWRVDPVNTQCPQS